MVGEQGEFDAVPARWVPRFVRAEGHIPLFAARSSRSMLKSAGNPAGADEVKTPLTPGLRSSLPDVRVRPE
jgi:hypothetical protein